MKLNLSYQYKISVYHVVDKNTKLEFDRGNLMKETIQKIMDTTDKKKVQSYCKKVIKKCSFKSAKDMKNLSGLVIWLYVYNYYDEIISVCELIENVEFTGNYTLWDEFDTIYCFKARVLRESGEIQAAQEVIEYVNQYRNPHLYPNLIYWFHNTLELNIKNAIEQSNSKSSEISWREVKLGNAIKYREAGQFPISDDELEKVIDDQIEVLSKVK